jgi:hypothetical protein
MLKRDLGSFQRPKCRTNLACCILYAVPKLLLWCHATLAQTAGGARQVKSIGRRSGDRGGHDTGVWYRDWSNIRVSTLPNHYRIATLKCAWAPSCRNCNICRVRNGTFSDNWGRNNRHGRAATLLLRKQGQIIWYPMIPAHVFNSFVLAAYLTSLATWRDHEMLSPVTSYRSIAGPMFIGPFPPMLTSSGCLLLTAHNLETLCIS